MVTVPVSFLIYQMRLGIPPPPLSMLHAVHALHVDYTIVAQQLGWGSLVWLANVHALWNNDSDATEHTGLKDWWEVTPIHVEDLYLC